MNFKNCAGAILAAALLFAGAVPLSATTIASYTLSDWISSTSGSLHDANFSNIQFIDYSTAGFTTSDGFVITGPDGGGSFLQGVSYSSQPSLKGGNDSSAQVLVTTPSGGQTALLFMFASSPGGGGYTLTLSDGEVFNLNSSTTIFGVSVSHPITSALFSTTAGSNFILEDVSYGSTNLPLDGGGGGGGGGTSSVPEASTTLLFASGLVLIAFGRKRCATR